MLNPNPTRMCVCVCVCVHPSAAPRLTGNKYRFVIRIFPSLHSSAVNQQDLFVMMMVYNQMSFTVYHTCHCT